MNKFHLAALLPALTLGLALPASAVDPTNQGTPDSPKMGQADQARPDTAGNESGNAAKKTQDVGKAKAGTAKQDKKHPPAAAMDSAMPTEKSPTTGTAAKHPPAAGMDSATSTQKSPDASSSGAPSTGSDAQPASGTK